MTAAQRERSALVDTLRAVGPDAPTLCDGWKTRDLAAHLVVRERRLDATPGIMVPFSPVTPKRCRTRSPAQRAGTTCSDSCRLARRGIRRSNCSTRSPISGRCSFTTEDVASRGRRLAATRPRPVRRGPVAPPARADEPADAEQAARPDRAADTGGWPDRPRRPWRYRHSDRRSAGTVAVRRRPRRHPRGIRTAPQRRSPLCEAAPRGLSGPCGRADGAASVPGRGGGSDGRLVASRAGSTRWLAQASSRAPCSPVAAAGRTAVPATAPAVAARGPAFGCSRRCGPGRGPPR